MAPFATDRILQRRSRRITPDAFLWQWLGEQVIERTAVVNREFKNVQVVTPTPAFVDALAKTRPDWTITTSGPVLQNGSYDAIIMLGLPAVVNDVPATFGAARTALKEGGLFLCGFLGGSTYAELRTALLQAEAEIAGGAAARVAPMIDAGTAIQLLQRAGFALPVGDHDSAYVSYRDLFHLVSDIRAANANAVLSDTRSMPRALPGAADAAYRAQFCDDRGRYVATISGVFLSGWHS